MTPNPMPPNPMPAPAPAKKSSTGIIIAVVGVALLCPCIGILAAIAIPNFIKFQGKAKQSEVMSNLKAAFTAEKAYFASENKYSESPMEVGFSPLPGNRYLYAFSTEGDLAAAGALGKDHTGVLADAKKFPGLDNDAIEKGVPQELWEQCGIVENDITIVGAGNIDNDATIDVWTVSTMDRTIDGVLVPGGKPHNHVNDLVE